MPETGWVRVPDDVAYRAVRENFAALLADRDGIGDARVPACPAWSVRDLVEHLVGNTGLVLGEGTGPRPEAPPAGAPLARLLDAWHWLGEGVDAHLHEQAGERMPAVLVMDALTHEVDLRYAIGASVPVDHVAYPPTFGVLTTGFGESVRGHGLPAVRVVCDGAEWVCGPGEPAVTLTGSRHDVHRVLAGRRSHAQIAALDWSADPGRWLPAFTWGPFTPPDGPGDVLRAGW